MTLPENRNYIGLDLGGTKVYAGKVQGNSVTDRQYALLPEHQNDPSDVIELIVDTLRKVRGETEIHGIGVGVPSILDRENGIIYEVQNIPLWKEVPLGPILEEKFGCPVALHNDASCFALGEYHFGEGVGTPHMVGLTLGTGMGAGIVSRGRLLGDAHCGAGEFGMMPYRDGILEDYCGGRFFKHFYGMDGRTCREQALDGDVRAIKAFEEYGTHLGYAIKAILYAVDPLKIVIGGAIAGAQSYFDASMRRSLSDFGYARVRDRIEIAYSKTPDMAILGSAALCLEEY